MMKTNKKIVQYCTQSVDMINLDTFKEYRNDIRTSLLFMSYFSRGIGVFMFHSYRQRKLSTIKTKLLLRKDDSCFSSIWKTF